MGGMKNESRCAISPCVPTGRGDIKMNVIWWIKQILPFQYCSAYRDGDGKYHHVKWRMWAGRCFRVNDRVLV
jgi:hypothetical protein